MNPLTVIDTVRLVHGREAKAIEILDLARERCAEHNGPLNAFVHLDWDRAYAAAENVDAKLARGQEPGALAGVPFGVKDLQNCAGMPTTYGSLLHLGAAAATEDSPSVARLKAAGAIPIGKTATAEWGMDSVTATRAFGTTRNPWDLSLTPGGSSGGSAAAVSGGIVPFATGTDEGGSIRSPAACCGLVGLKPTHGLVARDNGVSQANVSGVLTHTARDSARLLDVMSRGDPRDKMSMMRDHRSTLERGLDTVDVSGMKALWSDDLGYAVVDPEVASVARSAAERLIECARLVSVDRPVMFSNSIDAWWPLVGTRFLWRLEASGFWPSGADQLCTATADAIAYAREVDPVALGRAEQSLIALEREVAATFEVADFLFTPTLPCEPFAAEGPAPTTIAGREVPFGGNDPFTPLANLTWLPAISICAGFTARGLPVGLHVSARLGSDGTLLRLAHLWEQALDPVPPVPTSSRGSNVHRSVHSGEPLT